MSIIIDAASLRKRLIVSIRKRSKRDSSGKLALQVLHFLRRVILQEKVDKVSQLTELLHTQGHMLSIAEPNELVITNIVLMVSKLVRDEVHRKKGVDGQGTYDSLYTLWREIGTDAAGLAVNIKKIKKDLIPSLKEVETEIETSRDSVAAQASELIQAQDVVLVHLLNQSKTLDAFLASARRTTKYRVFSVVACSDVESSPDFVAPIQLCDVAGKMCETTKVVLSGAAVFPDGSCLVPAGGLTIALAAQRHSVPVYVLAAFYKITPFFIPDPMAMHSTSKKEIPFNFSSKFAGKVEVIQPAFDVLPAQLTTLFVSNVSCLIPAHVNRLKEDYYHPQDVSEYY